MTEWWESLSALQQVLAYIALPATFVLILQSILVLFGIGHGEVDAHGDIGGIGHAHVEIGHAHVDMGHAHVDAGHAHDHSEASDGFALFSIRGLVAFLSVGGWTGIVLDGTGANVIVTVFVSLLAGLAAMFVVALLFRLTAKLQSSGNIELRNAVGKSAKVYIPIPAEEKGVGKVTLTLQERFVEYDALTRAPQGLKTGEFVRVVAVANENTLIVEPESVAARAEEESVQAEEPIQNESIKLEV